VVSGRQYELSSHREGFTASSILLSFLSSKSKYRRHRPLPDNTSHSQQTDIYAPSGIGTHNPSKRAAADPWLRPRGNWDRRIHCFRARKLSSHILAANNTMQFWNRVPSATKCASA